MSLKIHMFDVGQGDGILVQFPNGGIMLVDLGSNKNKFVTWESVRLYCADKIAFRVEAGKAVLDYLILTHGDSDHYNMVEDFLDEFGLRISNLMFGGDVGHYKPGFVANLSARANRVLAASPMRPFNLINSIDSGGVSVRVLAMNEDSPTRLDRAWVKNTQSIVLQLKYSGTGVILSGDATFDTEDAILNTGAGIQSAVLKAGHHGSARTSGSSRWIRKVSPQYAFISSDRHGTSSEGKQTGFRLPQQYFIDMIIKNSKDLSKTFEEHYYVSHYDSEDYPGPGGIPNPHLGDGLFATTGWKMICTTKGIFTSLIEMGMADAAGGEGADEDQGSHHIIEIDLNGRISIARYPYF